MPRFWIILAAQQEKKRKWGKYYAHFNHLGRLTTIFQSLRIASVRSMIEICFFFHLVFSLNRRNSSVNQSARAKIWLFGRQNAIKLCKCCHDSAINLVLFQIFWSLFSWQAKTKIATLSLLPSRRHIAHTF